MHASTTSKINGLFQLSGMSVADYHNKDSACASDDNGVRLSDTILDERGIENGNGDDIKGLINFVRGKDYFIYSGDCATKNEPRFSVLGDIYHSQVVEVGEPSANTLYTNTKQEAYYRAKNGYNIWAASKANRKKTLYVGANDSYFNEPRLWINCSEENGDTIWNYYSDSSFSYGKSITKIEEKIIFCGNKSPVLQTNLLPRSYYLVGGIDSLGNLIFQADFNHYSEITQSCMKVIKKPNSNNYYFSANINQNNFNKIYSAQLINQWAQTGSSTINGNENDILKGLDTLISNEGTIIIGNTNETNNGFTDIFISKTNNGIWDSIYNNNLLLKDDKPIQSLVKIFPNPSASFINIENIKIGSKINIFDFDGKLIDSFIYNNSIYDSKKLKKGIYLLKINESKTNNFFKIIKL